VELLLELRLPAAGPGAASDVVVEVDPEDTVAALTDALATHAERLGSGRIARQGFGLFRSGTDQPFHPEARVVDLGLVSGESVTLAAAPPADVWAPPVAPPPPAPVGNGWGPPGGADHGPPLTLDVVAGPEAGRRVPLVPGSLTVGRADTCAIAVADATLSREHFMVHVAPDLTVHVVPNPAATNGTFVDDAPVTEARPLAEGEVVQAGSSAFVVRAAAGGDTRRRDRLGQVPFNRVPYRRTIVTSRRFDDVAAPPELQRPRKLSMAAALAPAMSAVGLALMMGRPQYLAIAALSPVMLVWRHFANKRSGKRGYLRDRDDYYARVDARAAEVDAALAEERAERLHAAPDLAELARQVQHHMPRLWERNRHTADFLELRLGLGELGSKVMAGIARGGHEELRAEGHARLAHHTVVRDVPITVNLVDAGVLGLCGDPATVAAVGSSLAAQAVCLHSPEDLVVVTAVQVADAGFFEWLKWVPHVRSSTSPLDGDHLAVGPEATRRLIGRLLGVAAARPPRAPDQGLGIWPRVLVVLQEAAEPDRAQLSQLLEVAPYLGINVVWLGESQLQVPRQCRAVVQCPGRGQPGLLSHTDPEVPDRLVALDGVRPDTALAVARALAPLRDASAGNDTTAIPRVVPLLDALGIDMPTSERIAESWAQPRPYGLSFPIGLSAEGPFHLDLVEQGPHTLIGGTSGAGKSELLQTLVLGLAANYQPSRLNFLFVDYKGGASSAEFRDLPHTVGYVTNLDALMSLRALTSLRAELQRRMGILEGRAKDLVEMLQVAPDEAPPSLVIVVDEFAALVKEIPDFVAGIVDIAQRGRSLGVHLVLATQRPTGVVNDAILANTNLRISLRVLDPNDSNNIIGTRDAADIPVPLRGRAYARTGPHTLVAFQCAWAGAPLTPEQQVRAVTVRRFGFGQWRPALVAGHHTTELPPGGVAALVGAELGGASGPGQVPGLAGMARIAGMPGAGDAPAGDDEPQTHLEVLVRACAGAGRLLALPPARRPWVEPLAPVVGLGAVLDRIPPGDLTSDPGRIAVIGLLDDPENQAQHVATIDLEASGGLLVFGTGGSGKTTLLRTVAASVVSQGSPDEVQVCGLDFASRSLDAVADLPHCSDIVPGDDPERVTRLLTVLSGEIERRRGILSEERVESLGALRARRAAAVMPRIILLLDSYAGFHGAFDRTDGYPWLAALQQVVSRGRQVGIHSVITTERRLGVPSALLAAVSARLALRQATPEDLTALGVPIKVAKGTELPNGRGFLGGTTEVQVACVSDDPSGAAQSHALAEAGARMARAEPSRAPALPALPEVVHVDRPSPRPLTSPFAVTDLTLELAEVDLTRQNLLVTGPGMSGKSCALETVAWGIRASTGPGLHLAAVGSAASPLAGLDVWDDAAFARAGHGPLIGRLTELLAGDEGVEARAVLFVDAAEDLEGNDVLRPLEALARSDALRLVVACEPTTVAKAFSGWLSTLRRNRGAIVLQPESRNDVESAVGVKPTLRPGQAFPPGRGIYVANRRWSLVQVGLRPGGAVKPPPDAH
jgi:S-DNA-T family DNA segregation ATPase FtsK/SpoIIIE